MSGITTGLHPSPPDERDWALSALPIAEDEPVDFASLKHYSGGVLDQKNAPVCAAASGCSAMELFHNIRFSMRWLYGKAKAIDGLEPGTPGTTFRAILQVLSKQGCCPEELCPTFPDWDNWDFTEEMDREAAKYKIAGYASLDVSSLDDIERAIANGFPVLVGSLVTDGDWLDGDEYIIEPLGSFKGGHGTLGLEHDRSMKYLTYTNFLAMQNSWGVERGRNGFYFMADHFARHKLDIGLKPLMEAWAIQFPGKLTPRFTREEEQKLLIGIDPGHGGTDPGALGLAEKDITLPICLALAAELKKQGIETVLTRQTDKYVSLADRTNLLNAKKVNYAVSVHINSSTDPEPDYLSTFIYAKGGKAEKLAEKVQGSLVKATGFKDGGVRVKNLHMVRETKMPAILVEAGFISNPAQEKWLQQNPGVVAKGIAKGICDYLGITFKEEDWLDGVSSWAKEAAKWAKEQGITDGTDPKGPVTREQAWVMLYRALGGGE